MHPCVRRLVGVFFLAILGLTARATEFSAVCESYYDDYRAMFPLDAAGSGDSDPRHEHLWQNDISVEHRALQTAFVQKYEASLRNFDRATLNASDQLSYDILRWTIEVHSSGLAQPTHLLPVNQFWGPPLLFAQMGSGASIHPFRSEQDYRNFISRAVGFGEWVDTAMANMRLGIARGVVQPRVLMERTLPQYEPLMMDDSDANIFFTPLKTLPADLAPADADKLRADYLSAIRTTIIPAYTRLHAFIKEEYLPHCRDSAGLSAVPGGDAMYASWVRYWTTTERDVDDIHQLGVSEVARIRGEMEKVKNEVGFQGNLPEFITFVTTDPQFAPFATSEEVLSGYREIEERLASAVPKLFGRQPRAKFEIRETEKFRAASASAEYQPGAADGSRPGIFYVPIVDPKLVRAPGMEYLFLHEAIPGHHFQFSITQENASLPRFRRFGWNSAYGEGWALYAEGLGQELGLYTDPYQYFGMLLGEMHRAVRLVVDTGIHTKGWTREQALRYAAEQEGEQERSAAEIERYMAAPGQALSYKIGQLKILELRKLAEQQLGPKFDLRAFHAQVLDEGSMPLSVLESRLNAWIEDQR